MSAEIRLRHSVLSQRLSIIGQGFASDGPHLNIGEHNSSMLSVTNKFDTLGDMSNIISEYHSILSSEMTTCINLTRSFVAQDKLLNERITGAIQGGNETIELTHFEGGTK